MDLSPQERRGIASVLVGGLLVVFGGVLLAGLTREALFSALGAAIFAAAIVIGAIFFHAAYRRAEQPGPPAVRVRKVQDEDMAFPESETARLEEPLRPEPRDEERPAP